MRKQKLHRVLVRCSRPVAQEMCRYDGSKIVQEELIEASWDRWVDTNAKRLGWTEEQMTHEKEQHRIYKFIIEGERITMGRWFSFGVHPLPTD